MAEFWYSPDSYTPSVQVAEVKQQSSNPMSVLNAELTKSGLRAELPESSEATLFRIKEETFQSFKKKWKEIPFEDIQAWGLWDDVFAVQASKPRITSFQKKTSELIFNLAQEAESPFIKNYKNPDLNDGKGIREAGYIEKRESGIWNLYELIGTDQKGEPVLGKRIDPKSPEYFKAWQDIVFYADTLNILFGLKQGMELPKQGVKNFVEWGSMKFEMLEHLLKKWYITEESFQIGVTEMRKILVAQCKDSRFDWFKAESEFVNDPELAKLWTRVKESDLKRYYDKRYIDEKLAKECFVVLPLNLRDVTGGVK